MEAVEAVVPDGSLAGVATDDREASVRSAVADGHADEAVATGTRLEEQGGTHRGVVEDVHELVADPGDPDHGAGSAPGVGLAGHVQESEDAARPVHPQWDGSPFDSGPPHDQVATAIEHRVALVGDLLEQPAPDRAEVPRGLQGIALPPFGTDPIDQERVRRELHRGIGDPGAVDIDCGEHRRRPRQSNRR